MRNYKITSIKNCNNTFDKSANKRMYLFIGEYEGQEKKPNHERMFYLDHEPTIGEVISY